MTTQEIKDLIMSKIAGQGSAVDAGSALPEILNGIVDAIGSATNTVCAITVPDSASNKTREQFAELLEITPDSLDKLFEGEYNKIEWNSNITPYSLLVSGGGLWLLPILMGDDGDISHVDWALYKTGSLYSVQQV